MEKHWSTFQNMTITFKASNHERVIKEDHRPTSLCYYNHRDYMKKLHNSVRYIIDFLRAFDKVPYEFEEGSDFEVGTLHRQSMKRCLIECQFLAMKIMEVLQEKEENHTHKLSGIENRERQLREDVYQTFASFNDIPTFGRSKVGLKFPFVRAYFPISSVIDMDMRDGICRSKITKIVYTKDATIEVYRKTEIPLNIAQVRGVERNDWQEIRIFDERKPRCVCFDPQFRQHQGVMWRDSVSDEEYRKLDIEND